MGDETHTDDLRNVTDGDSVTLHTTEGETFDVECNYHSVDNADPRSGEVRETKTWIFQNQAGEEICAAITDGLRSSPDDPEFPQHSQLWDSTAGENLGYIESLSIHGKMEA
jgi:hypothetical protein